MNSITVDCGTDFKALLDKAKRRFDLYLKDMKSVNAREMSGESTDSRLNIHEEYQQWLQDNILNKGLTLETEAFSGRPKSLLLPVAGDGCPQVTFSCSRNLLHNYDVKEKRHEQPVQPGQSEQSE